MQPNELLKQALNLPEKERAELAASLIDSLDPKVDEDVEAAWQAEIARRIEEIETGKARAIPWEEVREKGRRLLNGR
jgi:putative addiction module component (TIGR02574 family)